MVRRSMIGQVPASSGLTASPEGAQLRMRDSLVIRTEHHFPWRTMILPLALFTGPDAKRVFILRCMMTVGRGPAIGADLAGAPGTPAHCCRPD
jgi:hypothetical protein